jgi:hypothetical protein
MHKDLLGSLRNGTILPRRLHRNDESTGALDRPMYGGGLDFGPDRPAERGSRAWTNKQQDG